MPPIVPADRGRWCANWRVEDWSGVPAARKLTLADVELVARRMSQEWWDSLTAEERLTLVDQYNEVQAAEELMEQTLTGPPKRSRGT